MSLICGRSKQSLVGDMESLHMVILVLLVLLGLNLIQNIKGMRIDGNHRLEKTMPLISVLIPARNEEERIGRCATSLLESDYPHLEIIVLDDNSRDRTYEVVQRLSQYHKNLRIIKGQKLPPGWNGKNWACHQLAHAAKGEWFLFTDADTCHSPNSVSTAFEVAKKSQSHFVTAIPGLIMKTWAEKLILPVIHFAFIVLLPYKLINFSNNSRVAIGIGPFLFIQRRCYFSCGGFEAIKTEILDDMALARRVKQIKAKLSVIDGTEIVKVRFYTCFKEVWSGFSKNAFQAIGSSPHFLFGISLACYFLFVYPYFCLGTAVYYGQSITLPFIQVLIVSAIKLTLSTRFKTSIIFSLLHPIMIILTLLILFNSFRLTLFGKKIEWKERLYPVE
jgi:chlorobactene glucosyltransferase